ncbi:hypothetical protein N7456_007592 [Penicillium angulare]|uniref:Uncharacterized protein n=1 Tax=Penicillium angulare TaxID=116970 RepID=A0A9W9K8W5_9EURO|nr:hypothetical protein N7456_007592 [Penicillium angulare]
MVRKCIFICKLVVLVVVFSVTECVGFGLTVWTLLMGYILSCFFVINVDDHDDHDEQPGNAEAPQPPQAPEFQHPNVILDDIRNKDLPQTSGELVVQGIRVVNWITTPGVPGCSVRMNQLTWNELVALAAEPINFMPHVRTSRVALGYLVDLWEGSRLPRRWITWHVNFQLGDHAYGRTTDGIIVLDDITRTPGTTMPPISNIFLTLYARHHGSLDSLRYVAVRDIRNMNTVPLLSEFGFGLHIFEKNSYNYMAIMGTRIGRTVAYIVLAGFPRGSVEVTEIRLYRRMTYHLRFDLSPV